jgi:PEGA domain
MTPNRLPNGWVVLGGSVLASFIWWMASRPSNHVLPAPAPASAPAAAPGPVAAAPAPVKPPPSQPSASKEAPAAPRPEPAPEAPAPLPLLRVVGDIADANVFIDRKYVGKTPFETRDITPGGHQINVSAEGFDGMSRHVEVAADAPTEVTFKLKAVVLDSAVQVVHKHRLGSCQGRLSADMAGLRYAPTSGDDAFHTPLTGLETLALDYQEKMLRLKLKGGKSFNFTTRAANADPLFAFHRDVEKARKKLAGGA